MADFFATFHIDGKIILAQFVNFAIVFALIYFLVIKQLTKVMKDRKEIIEKGLEDAIKAETALTMAESEKEEILKGAYKESKKITEHAEVTGSQIVSESKLSAKEEADKIKEDAQKDIERRNKEIEKDLHKQYVDLVVLGIEKVAMAEIDKGKSEKFAENLLK